MHAIAPNPSQQCAPTFGAIPSAADLKKKQEDQEEADEKRAEIMAKIVQPDALATLNRLDLDQPEKARLHAARTGKPLALLRHIGSAHAWLDARRQRR